MHKFFCIACVEMALAQLCIVLMHILVGVRILTIALHVARGVRVTAIANAWTVPTTFGVEVDCTDEVI